ncbi:MAG: hypothetical protein HY897_11180 [Deltaproteobacteria bacterium]|nr:hypothetical protein [Deltaproteobacteria bacterium]
MSAKKTDIEFGEEVAGRTIVGGRGTAAKSGKVSVPVGIEKVLYLAATDPAFRERLRADRDAVISDAGIQLRRDEAAILRGVPDEQLSLMIENIDPAADGRRRFLKSVAACVAATSVVVGGAILSCEEDDTVDAGGTQPDLPDREDFEAVEGNADASVTVRGTRSDLPEDEGR